MTLVVFRLLLILSPLLLTGCVSAHNLYARTSVGHFHGNPQIIWKAPNSYTFVQNDAAPFYYVTSKRLGSRKIVPGSMRTDGGSIPRPLWVFTDLSPWHFLPAYIIHDWQFEENIRRGFKGSKTEFLHSADVLTEAVKTIMETRCDIAQRPVVLAGIDAAARTDTAFNRWNGILPEATECTAEGRNCVVTGEPCNELRAGKPCVGPYAKCGSRSKGREGKPGTCCCSAGSG